ncbi:transposase [Blautia sp. MSK.20.9]|nr:transposase [Blautia sp. MSK20_18]NSK11444.1 transposase [Blautia sp. MSK.20.9]
MAKKQKGSSNYTKLQVKIQKLHAKTKNQRNAFLQQEITRLVRKYDVIAVEDIDLRAIGGALKLGKNLHDNGFGMFRTMLTYKLEQKGSCFVKVDRWLASTKTCSHCGHVQKINLDERTYVCEE